MAIISRTEFAKLLGKKSNYVGEYVKRGKIISEADGRIDTDHPTNKAFLSDKLEKKAEAAAPQLSFDGSAGTIRTSSKHDEELLEKYKEILEGIPPPKVSDQILRHWQAVEKQLAAEKLELQIAKMNGELLPVAVLEPVIFRHNQSLLTAMKNMIDDVIRNIKQRKSLTDEDVAFINGKLVPCLNKALADAVEMTVADIDNLVSEHSEKRGRGEKIDS